jgi:hypothetical protein
MTTQSTPDPSDHEEIEALHERFCGRQGDAAIELQDRSYELGRKRGRADCAELLNSLKAMCAMWNSVCNANGHEPEHVMEYGAAMAAIAKFTGEAG